MILDFPFPYEGGTIVSGEIARRPVVEDRIRAAVECREIYGADNGDAMLTCVLSRIATFAKKKDDGSSETVRIPAEILGKKLDYADFTGLWSEVRERDFSPGRKSASKASSPASVNTVTAPDANSSN